MTENLLKVKTILQTRGCSDSSITNYINCINRFKNYFKEQNIQIFTEDNILNYKYSAASINVNRATIKYYYLVNWNIDFTSTLKRKVIDFVCPDCGKNKFSYSFSTNVPTVSI